MANQLSAYEQQRLDNIARNQAVLRSLGLLEEKKQPPTAPKKKCRHDDDDDDDVDTFKMPSEPSRRSDRVSKKPALYEGLTDAYFNKEENDDDDETTRPRVSTRPQRMLGSPRTSYADEYQRDPPPRRRAAKIDERRMTVHIPNLNAAPTAAAHDIPNAALMQPPERGRQFSAMEFREHLGAMGQVGASKFGVKTMGGTSRSSAHPCPFCNKPTLVRAADRATGFVYLKKHWCNGVENDKVRIY